MTGAGTVTDATGSSLSILGGDGSASWAVMVAGAGDRRLTAT